MAPKLHLGTRKGLFTLERGARGWSIASVDFLGDNCTMLLVHPVDGRVWAALGHGHFGCKLHRSNGDGYEEIAAPAYPPRGDDEPPWVDAFGRTVPDSLEYVWALEAADPAHGDAVWCGTVPGGLFRTGDGGTSWDLVDSLWRDARRLKWVGGGMDYPGIHSVCVHPRDAADVALGVSCGGVWKTADGGASWTLAGQGLRAEYVPPELAHDPGTQDVHRIARCAANPDVIWLQHHNGIFRSTDGGVHFTEIEHVQPSTFGFAVAAHPRDPDTAWFVPAIKDERRTTVGGRLVVTRTADGGRSFEQLSSGLPQEHVYDLVYRHALDVAPDGETLCLASTTGNLWISECGGESWTAISTHLPPVYTARFAPG